MHITPQTGQTAAAHSDGRQQRASPVRKKEVRPEEAMGVFFNSPFSEKLTRSDPDKMFQHFINKLNDIGMKKILQPFIQEMSEETWDQLDIFGKNEVKSLLVKAQEELKKHLGEIKIFDNFTPAYSNHIDTDHHGTMETKDRSGDTISPP